MKTVLIVLFALLSGGFAFDAYRDVKFMLSTRRNLQKPVRLLFRDERSILQSPFDVTKPTRFLVHGWKDYEGSDISTATGVELLKYYDFNVIFVDWSEGANTITAGTAAGRVPMVARFLASYLNWMRSRNYINFNRVQLIGFSMGAHVVGVAGKNTDSRVEKIIGLDPSSSGFNLNRPNERLNAGDAIHVECLHTNGGATNNGLGGPMCDADFFANGGSSQPGCRFNGCSHSRAVQLYIESINVNGFHSIRCQTQAQASRGTCVGGGGFWFNNPSNSVNQLRGMFHFATASVSPFARGPVRP